MTRTNRSADDTHKSRLADPDWVGSRSSEKGRAPFDLTHYERDLSQEPFCWTTRVACSPPLVASWPPGFTRAHVGLQVAEEVAVFSWALAARRAMWHVGPKAFDGAKMMLQSADGRLM